MIFPTIHQGNCVQPAMCEAELVLLLSTVFKIWNNTHGKMIKIHKRTCEKVTLILSAHLSKLPVFYPVSCLKVRSSPLSRGWPPSHTRPLAAEGRLILALRQHPGQSINVGGVNAGVAKPGSDSYPRTWSNFLLQFVFKKMAFHTSKSALMYNINKRQAQTLLLLCTIDHTASVLKLKSILFYTFIIIIFPN